MDCWSVAPQDGHLELSLWEAFLLLVIASFLMGVAVEVGPLTEFAGMFADAVPQWSQRGCGIGRKGMVFGVRETLGS